MCESENSSWFKVDFTHSETEYQPQKAIDKICENFVRHISGRLPSSVMDLKVKLLEMIVEFEYEFGWMSIDIRIPFPTCLG